MAEARLTVPRPRVACCLLNWNGKQDTLECLFSLNRSDYPAMSIVVADNASTDNSPDAIRSCSVPLHLIETGANLGFACGYNVVLRHVLQQPFDYLWLLNNDTVVRADTLTALVRKAESDPAIGAVGSVCYYADEPETVQVWVGAKVNLWLGTARNSTVPKPDGWFGSVYGASMLVRSDALRTVGLLDEGFFFSWEETDLCLRMRKAGWRLAGAPDSMLLHKFAGSTGRQNPVLDRYNTASCLRALRLYSPLPHLMVPLYILFRLTKKALTCEPERVRQVWAGVQDYRRSFHTLHSPATLRQQRKNSLKSSSA